MRQAEGHGRHLLVREAGYKAAHLGADAAHQLGHLAVVHALQVELVLDGIAELGVGHGQLLVCVLGHHLLQQLLEALGHLALNGGGSGGQGLGRVLELVELLELDHLLGLVDGLKVLVEVVRRLQLLLVQKLEDGEPRRGLEQHQHRGGGGKGSSGE